MDEGEKLKKGKPDKVLDLRGESCPEPQIEIVKNINNMKVGEILEILTDEEPMNITVADLCKSRGYPCFSIKEGTTFRVRILKSNNVT
ncbi:MULTISPECIES: sulfurtransferase TusA family protein [Acidianus]|uniref:Response regulator SirA n=1 Tax=Candidatus Acidianus copahuensis TaxID=1160895 RepID=A0A031LUI3_9CREN|nr:MULTISPECIES: sulfurtransferase TusA family protein [Acidianus]EZQ12037.1 response regulator SirA [Candidatus Acidianus copahuensis]NON61416.1 sulfurtransferase TusA family protein [Acidianus sp. RZ1]